MFNTANEVALTDANVVCSYRQHKRLGQDLASLQSCSSIQLYIRIKVALNNCYVPAQGANGGCSDVIDNIHNPEGSGFPRPTFPHSFVSSAVHVNTVKSISAQSKIPDLIIVAVSV